MTIGKNKLQSLEFARGIAALAVVMHHASQAADAFGGDHKRWMFEWGARGVDFFFILSGFIIYFIHGSDERSPDALRLFFRKRLHRIYVPYLPVALGLMALYWFLPAVSRGDREWSVFTSLTLMPTGGDPALSVAWTLVYEVSFYAFFAVANYVSGRLWLLTAAWVAMVVWINVAVPQAILSETPFAILLNPRIIEFVAGMALAHYAAQSQQFTMVIGTAVVFCGGLIARLKGLSALPDGLLLMPLLTALVMLERRRHVMIPRSLLSLGAASYSVYLVHNPIQSVIARLAASSNSWWVIFVACTVIGTIAGIGYHLVLERPALAWFSRTSRNIIPSV